MTHEVSTRQFVSNWSCSKYSPLTSSHSALAETIDSHCHCQYPSENHSASLRLWIGVWDVAPFTKNEVSCPLFSLWGTFSKKLKNNGDNHGGSNQKTSGPESLSCRKPSRKGSQQHWSAQSHLVEVEMVFSQIREFTEDNFRNVLRQKKGYYLNKKRQAPKHSHTLNKDQVVIEVLKLQSN